MTIYIDGKSLTFADVVKVARNRDKVELTTEAKLNVSRCEDFISDMVASGAAIYGVTTGIGEFARIRVSPEQGKELQRKIILSHSASTGDLQPPEVVRAAMLVRANTLANGYSGIRLSTLQTYIDILNSDIVPLVHVKGSLGCSGDLSPLAEIACCLLGVSDAFYKGERIPSNIALEKIGIKPVTLTYKEGLALINGTPVMTGEASLQLYDTARLLKIAMIASAMTLDALVAAKSPFDPIVHKIRPFHGQGLVSTNLLKIFDGSEIMAIPSGKVQDAYSIRCTPQVQGPTVDAFHYVCGQVLIELNSAVDNPLLFPEEKRFISAGNFHGQSISMAMDFMAIALSEIADLSQCHINRMYNPSLSGLPDFLIEGKGINSGLMIAQYTAAALVSENKVLSHPAVVDSISVSADQEDHVAMGPIAVCKYKEILRNVRTVVAIEMLSAAQALDFRKPLKPGKGTGAAYNVIRKHIPFMSEDRLLYPDIEKVDDLIKNNEILEAVEAAIGEIKLQAD